MCSLAYMRAGNVATTTESVDAPANTAEISLLICPGIENTDRSPGRTVSHTPHFVGWNTRDTKFVSRVMRTVRLLKLFDVHHL